MKARSLQYPCLSITQTAAEKRDSIMKIQQWIGRRWDRSLVVLAACYLIGLLLIAFYLVAPIENQMVFGAIGGFICAVVFSLLHVLQSVVGASRMSASFRGCLSISIPTIATWLIDLLPLNLDLQVIPIVFTYCICFGALSASIATRGYYGDELVARGNKILRSSTQTGDAMLVAFMAIFFWAQYKSLGGWYAANAAPAVLAWSIVLVLATSWGFLALSRFGERRLAYSFAVPTAVVAMISLYMGFKYQRSIGIQWPGFGAFLLTSLVGWFLVQETATRLWGSYGWKWRSIRRPRRRRSILHATQRRIRSTEQAWISIAILCLVTVTCAFLPALFNSILSPYYQDRYLPLTVGALSEGVGAAAGGFVFALVAHQRIGLLRESVLLAMFNLSISIISFPLLSYSLYQQTGVQLAAILAAVSVAILMNLSVRVADQFDLFTFGTVQLQRQRVSIGELLVLTLIIGLLFASLRFSEINIVLISTGVMLCAAWATTLAMRIYFLAPTLPTVLSVIALLAIAVGAGYYYRQYLLRDQVLSFCVYASAVVAITRWLKRQGWQKVELQRVG